LNYLGDKSAVRVGVALHQGLGLVYKSIRQRIAADVTDRQGLPFPFQHKINPAGNVVNTTGATVPPTRMRWLFAEPVSVGSSAMV